MLLEQGSTHGGLISSVNIQSASLDGGGRVFVEVLFFAWVLVLTWGEVREFYEFCASSKPT